MTRKTFLGTISDRAEQNFDSAKLVQACKSPIDPVLWKEWEDCWWDCAKKYLEELKEEGLTESVKALDTQLRSVDFKKEYMNDSELH